MIFYEDVSSNEFARVCARLVIEATTSAPYKQRRHYFFYTLQAPQHSTDLQFTHLHHPEFFTYRGRTVEG
jgi:hypothetical protein